MPNDDDDDILGPDAEPTAAERAHAKTFAALVDKTLAGRAPPAMGADDRALLEVAGMIRAAKTTVELGAGRSRSIVEDALRAAVGDKQSAASLGLSGAAIPLPISRLRRWAPWTIAGASALVAAAAVLLWIRAPRTRIVTAPRPVAQLPAAERSRSADALIGPIARDHAGDAATRIDAIFADRLDGFRELRYGAGGQR